MLFDFGSSMFASAPSIIGSFMNELIVRVFYGISAQVGQTVPVCQGGESASLTENRQREYVFCLQEQQSELTCN